MRNVKYLYVYIGLIIYTLLSTILEVKLPKIFNLVINPLVFIGITIYLYIKTNNKHGRFVKNKEHVKKMIIISLIYIITYFFLGFVFGFLKSPYSHKIVPLLKNFWQILVPIVGIEYIRSVLVNSNRSSKLYIMFSLIIFFVLELGVNSFLSNIVFRDEAFKYMASSVIPLFASSLLYTYLSIKGSYTLVLAYRVIVQSMMLLAPVYPNFDWFVTGIIGVLVPALMYVLFKYDFEKRKRDSLRENLKKSNPLTYVPFFALVLIFCAFMIGMFEYQPIAIVSNSMYPVFKRGDAVIFSKVNEKSLKEIEKGTIIIYRIGNQQIVHRVIAIKKVKGEIFYQTKGDANNSPDLELVSKEQIIGIYNLAVGYIGYPSVWLSEFLTDQKPNVEIK
ncbi:MAG: signal peptidase I [Bacilli bacterium]|nr:signal peptidase I [Bacilli bacterium]